MDRWHRRRGGLAETGKITVLTTNQPRLATIAQAVTQNTPTDTTTLPFVGKTLRLHDTTYTIQSYTPHINLADARWHLSSSSQSLTLSFFTLLRHWLMTNHHQSRTQAEQHVPPLSPPHSPTSHINSALTLRQIQNRLINQPLPPPWVFNQPPPPPGEVDLPSTPVEGRADPALWDPTREPAPD